MNVPGSVLALLFGHLVLGAVAFAILVLYYPTNVPLLVAAVAAFLCSAGGGYVATRPAQVRGLAVGALSGLVAGLVILLVAAVVTRLSPNTTLAAVLLTIIFAAGGALGGWLTRVRLSLELA